MNSKCLPLLALISVTFLSACEKTDIGHLSKLDLRVVEVEDEGNPLYGVKLEYSKNTFLFDAEPSLGYAPDQGPILYNHIELSERVFVGPITDNVDAAYPFKLTLPLKVNSSAEVKIENIYVLGWGDEGWVKFIPVARGKSSVTIEFAKILYDPFVAVIDK